MLKRISRIRLVKFNSLGIASVFQVGDTNEIDMSVKVFAVQRSRSTFYNNEGSFNKKEYQIFQQQAVKPILETGVQSAFCHEMPAIYVRSIKIQGFPPLLFYMLVQLRLSAVTRESNISDRFSLRAHNRPPRTYNKQRLR